MERLKIQKRQQEQIKTLQHENRNSLNINCSRTADLCILSPILLNTISLSTHSHFYLTLFRLNVGSITVCEPQCYVQNSHLKSGGWQCSLRVWMTADTSSTFVYNNSRPGADADDLILKLSSGRWNSDVCTNVPDLWEKGAIRSWMYVYFSTIVRYILLGLYFDGVFFFFI